MENEIIKFYNDGNNLSSPEGVKLLEKADIETIREAVTCSSRVRVQIYHAINDSEDAVFRKKILKALGD